MTPMQARKKLFDEYQDQKRELIRKHGEEVGQLWASYQAKLAALAVARAVQKRKKTFGKQYD